MVAENEKACRKQGPGRGGGGRRGDMLREPNKARQKWGPEGGFTQNQEIIDGSKTRMTANAQMESVVPVKALS